jgi:tetratricopeptide (TPR) repeat protein
MNKSLAIGLLAATAVVAQQVPPPPPTPPNVKELARQLRDQVRADARQAAKDVARAHTDQATVSYDAGTLALDEHKYDEAIRRFSNVVDSKSPRADGALYWKGYALNRAGRRDEALASLATLRQNYPTSRWLNDAQALDAEVKQGSGQAVSPADETNEDLKLMAINSLMNADPERAMPLLEGLLKGNSAPGLKDRALFVLTQNRSPRAQQILFEYARGAGNPDLQLRAIRYIGMSGTSDAQQQLSAVYTASNDPEVKREIIRSLMVSKGRDPLFNLAKNEQDADLRGEAIRQLGAMKATDQLSQLYSVETSADNRIQIARSLVAAGATDKLLDLVRSEKDPAVRSEAVRNLAMSRSTTPETLTSLYTADTDAKAKRELINSLHSRGDAKAMVDLARKETDPAMKKYIVQRLGTMQNKDAVDYMMELLK